MSVAEECMDRGWEPLPALVGAVRGRERIVRPGESSITVTSVMGSEMSVRADEKFSGAETTRWLVVVMWVRARGSRGGRMELLAAVVDGPGSALCVSLVADLSICGEKDLS